MMSRSIRLSALGLWFAAVIVGPWMAGCQKEGASQPQSSVAAATPPVSNTGSQVQSSSGVPSYADVVERVSPGVVTIHAGRRLRAPRQHPFFNDPLLRDFF